MKCIGFRPTIALIKCLSALAAVYLLLMLFSEALGDATLFAHTLLIALVVVTLIDAQRARTPPVLTVARDMSTKLSFNRWQKMSFELENPSQHIIEVALKDHLPRHFEQENSPEFITIAPGQKALVQCRIRSLKRGASLVGPLEMCIVSPWRLWQFFWLDDTQHEVKTYPDFERLKQFQSLNGVSNLPINGLKQMKKRGSGIEFHQLREYRQGDSVKQIDWQATSKRRKLISREYQEERNQHVIVMLDAGGCMNIETEAGSHFDAALNALLMLSHTVLKQGDWFSMQSFNQNERWLSAVKGAQNVSRVMNHFYDLASDESASDYMAAVTNLLAKRSKRSLVLLVTTLNDQNFIELLPAIKKLQQRHLVALVNIENVAVSEVIAKDIQDEGDAYQYCAALELRNQHRLNLKKVEKEGVICIDTQPQHLLPYVINTYLNVKHSGML